ncbi:MAG: hypothetical protein DSY50_00915 [Desulfobulbus sp.]|nr:MAG: hypothetical protein DSY50_00915 [Desulfobulbus sp.]RUM38424.1 MAG: hypothetical protein DSY70_07845 [Desulfobulbus sp.]
MYKVTGIALLTFLLFSGVALADGANRHNRHNRLRDHHYFTPQPIFDRQGWDVSPRAAERSPNCYRYALYVDGGRGSARITSLPGKNYIQLTNGQKNGYVCFNRPATLELGKLADAHVDVVLDIENVGIFYFDGGDRGSKQINNWLRSYWSL